MGSGEELDNGHSHNVGIEGFSQPFQLMPRVTSLKHKQFPSSPTQSQTMQPPSESLSIEDELTPKKEQTNYTHPFQMESPPKPAEQEYNYKVTAGPLSYSQSSPVPLSYSQISISAATYTESSSSLTLSPSSQALFPSGSREDLLSEDVANMDSIKRLETINSPLDGFKYLLFVAACPLLMLFPLLIPLQPIEPNLTVNQLPYLLYNFCTLFVTNPSSFIITATYMKITVTKSFILKVIALCVVYCTLVSVFLIISMGLGKFPIVFSMGIAGAPPILVFIVGVGLLFPQVKYDKEFKTKLAAVQNHTSILIIWFVWCSVILKLFSAFPHQQFILVVVFQFTCVAVKFVCRITLLQLGTKVTCPVRDTFDMMVLILFFIELTYNMYLAMMFPSVGESYLIIILYVVESLNLFVQVLVDTTWFRKILCDYLNKQMPPGNKMMSITSMLQIHDVGRDAVLQRYFLTCFSRLLSNGYYIFYSLIIYYGYNQYSFPTVSRISPEAYKETLYYATAGCGLSIFHIILYRFVALYVYRRDMLVLTSRMISRRKILTFFLTSSAVIFPFILVTRQNNIG